MSFSRLLWKFAEIKRLSFARIRSKWFAVCGAAVGAKCLFGCKSRIDRPWTTKFGTRCVLEPDVWFDVVSDDAEIVVGDHVFIGRGTHLLISDGVSIGDHCLIGDGVVISDHKHNTFSGELIDGQGCSSDRITIGDGVLLCVGSVILQGVHIGEGAIVGPGAVVSQDVKPGSIVGSPPARMLGMREGNV
ncbi:2,3,4,5-tetrahydropyridine-2,6-dicarboxylate N-acetyltransferase [Novipirellula galeiformis]|uniref:2,3,4,5-tetrahydropyridine-2,6-dicarboxylate N-acetyltransferase n=1 Tax=Novipirellula galeiformis TaxID=2528004 RepID=A0A5C6CRZ1_9BACT|nr:acyltransferase [Novipirellula galeiformis]TWU27168.1 2,3,4,5-tetrahydropyridine-2,6-dicarboxylate N-acetyltransferase [Novipirellula galeiformis]